MRNHLFTLGALLVAGCSADLDHGAGIAASEGELSADLDEACGSYAFSPDGNHLVYGQCGGPAQPGYFTPLSGTVVLDLVTGESVRVATSPSTPSWYASTRYTTFDDGFVVPTMDGLELYDWGGYPRAKVAIPDFGVLGEGRYAFQPTNAGAGLVAWRVEGTGSWQLRSYAASGNGPTSTALSAALSVIDPVTTVRPAPDGSHLLVWGKSASVYRVGTDSGTPPARILSNIGTTDAYDGHGFFAHGRGPALAADSGKLFWVDVSTNSVVPVSTGPVVGDVEKGGRVVFTERLGDDYRVGAWTSATPAVPAVAIAQGHGTPRGDVALTTDGGYAVFKTVSNDYWSDLHAVALGGASSEIPLGRVEDRFAALSFGPGASLAYFGPSFGAFIVADLASGARHSVSSGDSGIDSALQISRDGLDVFQDVSHFDGTKYTGTQVFVGAPDVGLELAYRYAPASDTGHIQAPRDRRPFGARQLLVVEATNAERWHLVRVGN